MATKTSNECQWHQHEHLQFWLFVSFCTNGFFFFNFVWLNPNDKLYKHWLINPSEYKLSTNPYQKQRKSTMATPNTIDHRPISNIKTFIMGRDLGQMEEMKSILHFVKLAYFTFQIRGLSAHVLLFSLIFEKKCVPPSSAYSLNV